MRIALFSGQHQKTDNYLLTVANNIVGGNHVALPKVSLVRTPHVLKRTQQEVLHLLAAALVAGIRWISFNRECDDTSARLERFGVIIIGVQFVNVESASAAQLVGRRS